MARNPKAKDNLRPFPKGVSGNPAGRPKSLAKVIKEMPDEAQAEIYGVLYHAITLCDFGEAKTYLNQVKGDKRFGKYGFVFQLALKSLLGPYGWKTLNDILDRLIGRPGIQTEIKLRSPRKYIVIGDARMEDKVQPDDFIIHVDSREEAEKIMTIGNLEV